MTLRLQALVCATFLAIGCSDPAGSGASDPPGSSGASSASGGPSSGSCPFTLTDGATYNAVTCEVQGAKTFAAGVYSIQISAAFNSKQPIRSVMFTLNDSNLPTDPHVKTFPVGTANPGVNASYNVVTVGDQWGTLSNGVPVGSGSLVVTEYDRTNKLISGTFDIVVKQGASSKTITGTLTHLPMLKAE